MRLKLGIRTQLLLSYLVLLVIALSVIAVSLFIFLSARPAPTQPTYNRLAAILQGLSPRNLLQGMGQAPLNAEDFQATLQEFADTRNVRVIWLNVEDEQNATVLFDSAQFFTSETTIRFSAEQFSNARLAEVVQWPFSQIYGSIYHPDGEEWLFGGMIQAPPENRALPNRRPDVTNMWLIAEPRPTASLQEVLGTFGQALFMPIIQAGLVGLIIAIVMAFLTSRNIARPLQAVAEAAGSVAKGDYHQQVPVSGPLEVQAVANSFNRMSTEVRRTQQIQRDFLANVSHDLKTPLTSIQGYSQAIIDGAAKDIPEAAEIIHDEAARLNRMVIELTDLIRIQSGRLSLKMSAVNISEIAEAIGSRLVVVAEKKGIKLTVETSLTPQIAGDGDRLAQVLTNLISNAIKHTPQGGKIRVSAKPAQDGVQFSIQDTGEGIPKEDLPRIFERFYQVDKARGPDRGTGLGLAIVYEIVQAHGGKIRATSAGLNRGTKFTVWLPLPNLETVITERPRKF